MKLTQFDITKTLIETEAKTLKLTSSQKYILVTLSSYLGLKDGEWTCHPSQERIAKLTGVSRKTVNKALSELEEKGYLKAKLTKKDHTGFYKLYTFQLNTLPLKEKTLETLSTEELYTEDYNRPF